MENIKKREVPPRGKHFDGYKVFTERFVIIRGAVYYMRVFKDDSMELSTYDEKSKKWIYLCFPSEPKTA